MLLHEYLCLYREWQRPAADDGESSETAFPFVRAVWLKAMDIEQKPYQGLNHLFSCLCAILFSSTGGLYVELIGQLGLR